ncbi:MAG TPA: photosynthetic reaction center cytochrome c subunit family protein [Bryobacteraceae bacterium]|nr:photosynthetic reaction center cytochrome c subunit family protein [Bryobacteraceae bacterium]
MQIKFSRTMIASAVTFAALFTAPAWVMAQPQQGRGGQTPAAPTGPLAPEKYKNIQVLTNVPADEIETTMRYVSAAVGQPCSGCHVQEASGQFSYEKDDRRTKQTARNMMKMVLGINASNYGLQVECATCHAGRQRPVGLPMAEMMTPEQVAQMNAAPAGGPGRGPGGGFGGRGGRGAQTPPPAVDAVLNKYFDAIGGRAAVDKVQSLTRTGTLTNRAGQTVAFTIEEKGNKFRETEETKPGATVLAFDGSAGWMQADGKTADLAGFLLDQTLRLNDLGRISQLSTRYPTLQASGRPFPINGKSAISVMGRAGIVMEQFFFDSESGLLVRRVVMTRTPLGALREQFDYSDYRPAGDVKIPYQITRQTWDAYDTMKISDAKANAPVEDARFTKPN